MQPANNEDSATQSTQRQAQAAADILGRVFKMAAPGIQFRLWDGTQGSVGSPDGSFTLVLRDRQAFARAFSTQNSKVMAEAFVDNQIDVEGDLFACLRVANQLEDISLGWLDKLAIWRGVRRIAR